MSSVSPAFTAVETLCIFSDASSAIVRKKHLFSEDDPGDSRRVSEEMQNATGQNQSEPVKTRQRCTGCSFLPYLRLVNLKKKKLWQH